MLDAKYHVEPNAGCMCRYVRSDTEYFRPHNHNYYELFLFLKGKVCHIVNGQEQLLSEGQLLFIRDFDLHDYRSRDGNYFEFLNLAFSKETFAQMLDFLGSGYPFEALLVAPFPPIVSLSSREKESLVYDFIELSQHSDPDYIRFKARTLLTHIFSNFFYNYTEPGDRVPAWLESTCEKMKHPQNFIAGIDRMFQLSGKTREHVARCMKQYYHTTPTDFVSSLRLEHAAKLLLMSNLQVTDICYECGFDNLSWFLVCFTRKSPLDVYSSTRCPNATTDGYPSILIVVVQLSHLEYNSIAFILCSYENIISS